MMVIGVWDNQQPDDLEAGGGVYVTLRNMTSLAAYFLSHFSLSPDVSRTDVSEETLID